MAVSVFDLFKIGIGPSSSHTVGPMRAALLFVEALAQEGQLTDVVSVKVGLYGSLGATGRGHGTDRGVMLGLMGEAPDTVDASAIDRKLNDVIATKRLRLLGRHEIAFVPREQIGFYRQALPAHPNAMTLTAFGPDKAVIRETTYLSVGGGFVVTAGAANTQVLAAPKLLPFPFKTGDELLQMSKVSGKSFAQIMWENELAWRDEAEIHAGLQRIWEVMQACVEHGCEPYGDNVTGAAPATGASSAPLSSPSSSTNGAGGSDEKADSADAGGLAVASAPSIMAAPSVVMLTPVTLPGPLNVRRRAPELFKSLRKRACRTPAGDTDPLSSIDWLNLFAIAVNEENAAGGRVVTAPTNGAAGIVPAVLHYYARFMPGANAAGIETFLLTAAAIGILYKLNASISGAEVGCQGEVGVACSMAAAALAAVMGGSPEQVEYAAEIGMEHNLGLTCDPVGGRVQIPCIERNAMGAVKALNAARMAMQSDGEHYVSLDSVIKTMRETGADMKTKYKETSRGGLAVNIVEC